MDIHIILNMLLTALLPALWTASGPVVTTAITAWTNSVVGKYVPRPVQVILSGVLTSVVAGLTGSMIGLDQNMAAGTGLAIGLGAQTFASLHPDTMLSSPPPAVKPAVPVA